MSGNSCAAAYKELLEQVNIVSYYDHCLCSHYICLTFSLLLVFDVTLIISAFSAMTNTRLFCNLLFYVYERWTEFRLIIFYQVSHLFMPHGMNFPFTPSLVTEAPNVHAWSSYTQEESSVTVSFGYFK